MNNTETIAKIEKIYKKLKGRQPSLADKIFYWTRSKKELQNILQIWEGCPANK